MIGCTNAAQPDIALKGTLPQGDPPKGQGLGWSDDTPSTNKRPLMAYIISLLVLTERCHPQQLLLLGQRAPALRCAQSSYRSQL